MQNKFNPAKTLTLGFLFIVVLGGLLLKLPVSLREGAELSLIDALFTAVSATCITGLVTVDTGTTFSTFGQIIILLLIQIGGLGFMTFATMFALVLRKKIGIQQRVLVKESVNHLSLDGIIDLVKWIFIFSFVIELAGFILLSIIFSIDMPLKQALFFALFHSISFFNNAGFDLFGSISGPLASLSHYANDPFLNMTAMSLIFIGGLGFLVVLEIYEKKRFKSFSLHTKIVLTVSISLVCFGAVFIFLLEFQNPKSLGHLAFSDQLTASFFHSITTRSGGISTISLNEMHHTTIFIMVLLMFIGGSPGSAAGGIKTTTFASLLALFWSQIRGKEEVVLFKKRLSNETILRAVTITIGALLVISTGVFVLCITEPGQDFMFIVFEVVSAFSTVGLSLGLTPELSAFGKSAIMLMMFLGRIGLITFSFALARKPYKGYISHPEEKITIG